MICASRLYKAINKQKKSFWILFFRGEERCSMVDRMSLVIQKDGKTYAIDTSSFEVDYDTILEMLSTVMPAGSKMKAFELSDDHKWVSQEHAFGKG